MYVNLPGCFVHLLIQEFKRKRREKHMLGLSLTHPHTPSEAVGPSVAELPHIYCTSLEKKLAGG
ncbi:hypothetical protein EXN66_Car004347 [Channa argus]|uniref:Uncharacterized protein n=1 Tax=Channa argus TaxID=215402 RepID=A0A6G1PEI4_CHAAH|nr:hypothetical protein EXN66_Car004347 [Channa argus]